MNTDIYVIAEVGSVHDGSFGNALKMIETAAMCGADAVKFQTHIPSAETLNNAPQPCYFNTEPRFEYFARTGFSLQQWRDLKAKADGLNIDFLSSPFSEAAVELLEKIGISRYKIPSGEVTNLPMLQLIAQTGKPVLLSSGMSDWMELDRAVKLILNHHEHLCVMQCSSIYPCPDEKVGLNLIDEMAKYWGISIGYSDHTLENYACFAAASLGVSVIEKHLTFSRLMYGSDACHSAEPKQFSQLVQGIRAISRMRTNPIDKNDLSTYIDMKQIFEKSVVSIQNISKGSLIGKEMVSVKKPGTGIPAARLGEVVGAKAARNVAADCLLQDDDILWPD